MPFKQHWIVNPHCQIKVDMKTSYDDDALVQIISEIENGATQPNTEMPNRVIEQLDLDMFEEQIPSQDIVDGNNDWDVISSN